MAYGAIFRYFNRPSEYYHVQHAFEATGVRRREQPMASDGEPVVLEPLIGTNRAGVPYRRLPAVEFQIRSALPLGKTDLVARAKISDKSSQGFLKEECLVYLVRAAYLRGDADGFNTATELLLRRFVRWAGSGFRNLGVAPDDIEDQASELGRVAITEITSTDGRGDFYQVRFWVALKRDLLNVHDHYERQIGRERHYVSLTEPAGGDAETDDGGAVFEEIIGSGEDVGSDVERRLLIAEALAAIHDPRHRQAFVLHHLDDWQIEAKDATDPSISRLFDVTPRTVQNWLRTAESDLAAWRAARSS